MRKKRHGREKRKDIEDNAGHYRGRSLVKHQVLVRVACECFRTHGQCRLDKCLLVTVVVFMCSGCEELGESFHQREKG